MKISLQSTELLVTVNGAPARIWQGETESGIPIFALIAQIAVKKHEDSSQFEAELIEHVPLRDAAPWPLHMVL